MDIDQSTVEDLFGIPRDGRNIQDDSEEDLAVGDKSEASVPFEEKAKELVNDLKEMASRASGAATKDSAMSEPKKEEPKKPMFGDIFDDDAPAAAFCGTPEPGKPAPDEVKPEPKVKEKAPEKVVIPEGKEAPKTEKKVVETKPEMPLPEPKATPSVDWDSVPEPPPKEESKPKPDGAVFVKQDSLTQPLVTGAPIKVSPVKEASKEEEEILTEDSDGPCEEWTSGDRWITDSPAPKYNRFYQEKAIALGNGSRGILPGGEIPFGKYFKELLNLNCDVTVQTNDLESIHQKMQMVQQLRERCKQIQLHATQQYHIWERYIELFHGVLCRVEYERGKQEGLNFEHMGDMEHYFCSLKALHKAADQVMRTLDGAFECLSRQVTIAMPMREIERYGGGSNAGPRPISPDQKRFDALKAPAAAPSKPATGSNMGWNL